MFFDHLVLGATGEFLNIGDILVTLVIFILLMVLLKKFAWGPLMGIMQQREDLIKSEIETAENSRLESHKLLEEQRSLLKDARTQAQEIVENAKKHGEVSREEIITTARAESGRMKDAAVQEIANERDKAISAVREEVVALSMLAATKVLEKEISEEDNRQLINETIAKAGEVQ
ncbi:ATP synthase B chain [Planococcus antarcticus DSM 14505]|uniref:ATP synthase subunit b n=1 Tax=Planococcus antarcticus DSM 14505 TaxID=1185653 RepID=A0A1C7DF29_9BACL|nr:F0F1 ATP synthase subunit B [Planococcus antarcticus]ANU10054.1 ATP synthase F0 subunit B [Planococcus antarcticus DSM 14505]EIM07359.1 ATP synthase B chain [Planococcus antarcticus DSM 14505]